MYKLKHLLLAFSLLFTTSMLKAQHLMDMIDTTKAMGQDLQGIIKKYNHLRISGYVQPQFQVAESEGAKSYAGGDFAAGVDNRFMLRRARVRLDYAVFSPTKNPKLHFAFQFDASERGVFARDVWGRLFENKYNCFSLVTGLFARPFGAELNYSSSDRESPDRGRMSQILMRTERDMGAMITFLPQRKNHPLHYFEANLGVFNGQGLISTADYDKYKDIIGRVQLKNYPIAKNVTLSVSGSYFNGGIKQSNKTIYQSDAKTLDFLATTDSTKIGSRAPRIYYGADAQLKITTAIGLTEFRAEYIAGTQSATSTASETPTTLPTDPLYSRSFDGAYLHFLQRFAKKHQIIVRYDWYDANKSVSGLDIKPNTKLSAADLRYSTLSLGYIYYIHENLKAVLWYDIVENEKTQLAGYTEDLKDNILTCRLHYRF